MARIFPTEKNKEMTHTHLHIYGAAGAASVNNILIYILLSCLMSNTLRNCFIFYYYYFFLSRRDSVIKSRE